MRISDWSSDVCSSDLPTTVITGLDPVIQGDRSIACSGPSARGPRVTGGGRRTRIAPSLSQRLRQRGELVGDLAPALVEAHLLVRLAILRRPVQRAGGVARLAVPLFVLGILEGDDAGEEGLVGGLPGPVVGVGADDLLVLTHLEVDAAHRHVLAFRTLHDDRSEE